MKESRAAWPEAGKIKGRSWTVGRQAPQMAASKPQHPSWATLQRRWTGTQRQDLGHQHPHTPMWELIQKGRSPGSPSAPHLDLQCPLDPSPYACGTFVNVATTMRLKCGDSWATGTLLVGSVASLSGPCCPIIPWMSIVHLKLGQGLNQAGKEGSKAAGKKPNNNEYCTSFPTGQKSQV